MKLPSIYSMLLWCIGFSCGPGNVDMEEARIVIAAPGTNHAYAAGQPVAIRANITDNEMLELVKWHVLHHQPGTRSGRITREVAGELFEPDTTYSPFTTGRYAVLAAAEDKFSNISVAVIEFNVQ